MSAALRRDLRIGLLDIAERGLTDIGPDFRADICVHQFQGDDACESEFPEAFRRRIRRALHHLGRADAARSCFWLEALDQSVAHCASLA